MPSEGDRLLHKIIEDQINRNAFSAQAAADRALPAIAKLDGLKLTDISNLKPYAYDGLKYRAQRYDPGLRKVRKAYANDDEIGQGDFSAMSADFLRLLNVPVALDEWEGTVRLPPMAMDLAQIRIHIELKRRKADEAWAAAEALERLVTRLLKEWEKNPERTLAEMMNINPWNRRAG